MKLHGSGTTSSRGYGSACLEDESVTKAHIPASLKTAQDPDGGRYPVYPSGKSWDEVLGKMSSGKKFYGAQRHFGSRFRIALDDERHEAPQLVTSSRGSMAAVHWIGRLQLESTKGTVLGFEFQLLDLGGGT